MDNQIYMDNASTTKVDTEVLESMLPYFNKKYGNPSSPHKLGQDVRDHLEKAREIIAKSINAEPDEIIFTSTGTESNNLAIRGVIYAKKGAIITSQIEHESILGLCKQLAAKGIKSNFTGVDKLGNLNINKFQNNLSGDTTIASIIHVNNEIGTIQELTKVSKKIKEQDILFHTDACQSYTKIPINVKNQNLDLVTLNSHKIHGPKGIAALYIKQGTKIKPIIIGGGHEFGYRSGTENVAAIIGFAKAVDIARNDANNIKMNQLRKALIKGVLEIPETELNGPIAGICNIANFSFRNLQGESIVSYLDENNVCASVGSACTTNKLKPSHVLRAIGLSTREALSSVRFSLSRFNTMDEIDKVLQILPRIIHNLRKLHPNKRK